MRNATSIAAALLLTLASFPNSSRTAALSDQFNIRVGATQQIAEAKITIKFVAVEYDGRCPIGATCVWQGDALAKFILSADRSSMTIGLHTAGGTHMPRSAEALGYTVSMISLGPYPRQNVKTPPNEHVATLSISRN